MKIYVTPDYSGINIKICSKKFWKIQFKVLTRKEKYCIFVTIFAQLSRCR